MRFATSSSQPASLDAHGKTKRQRSCSHYTAICNQRVKKRRELRTHEQPLIAEHKGGTNPDRFERSRTRRTHEVPFIAGRSHFTLKNTRFPAPAFPQNEAHVTSMQPLQCVLQLQVPNPHLSTHMARQNDNDHAAITLRSATRRVKKRRELRTHEQPLVAEHKGGTNPDRFERSRTRRTHEVPFIAGRSHFTLKNTRFPAPAFPQNEAHVTSMQPLQCVLPPFIEYSLTLLIVM